MSDATAPAPVPSRLAAILAGLTAESYLVAGDAPVLTISAGASITDALVTLRDNHVTGAPVVVTGLDVTLSDFVVPVVIKHEHYLGFIDVADLVASLLSGGTAVAPPEGALAVTRRIVEFFRAKPTLVGTAEAVVNLSGRDKFVTVPSSASLLQIANLLVVEDVHRVAVVHRHSVSGDERVGGLLTQSDLLHVLNANAGALGDVAAASIASLFPAAVAGAPITVPTTSTLRACFDTLLSDGINGCAVVNDTGVVVGNVSVADVRELASDVLAGTSDAVLASPVLTFLGRGEEGLRAPVTAKASDTLAALLAVMDGAHVHRVHVVDDAGMPLGVVTAMDVLRTLLGQL